MIPFSKSFLRNRNEKCITLKFSNNVPIEQHEKQNFSFVKIQNEN